MDRDILIDVWASWCKDCIKSLPKLKELQSSYPNLDYIFLSLDKSQKAWRRGIERIISKESIILCPQGGKDQWVIFLI